VLRDVDPLGIMFSRLGLRSARTFFWERLDDEGFARMELEGRGSLLLEDRRGFVDCELLREGGWDGQSSERSSSQSFMVKARLFIWKARVSFG